MTIHRWRAFAVLAVAYFMTIVDLTIVHVSLPTIGRDLITAVVLLAAFAIPIGGVVIARRSIPQAGTAATTPALATSGR